MKALSIYHNRKSDSIPGGLGRSGFAPGLAIGLAIGLAKKVEFGIIVVSSNWKEDL
jgi:hypothetical protein